MRGRGCRTVVALAAAAAAVWTAPSASGAGQGDGQRAVIDSVSDVGNALELHVRALDLPAAGELRPEDVEVRLDGHPVTPEVVPVVDRGVPRKRRVVLVLDTSGSMAGARIEGARAAAATYLDLVPKDAEVGLVTFSSAPRLLVPPTGDRAAVAAALPSLVSEGETGLYDAVLLARQALGDEGERRMVILSDGEDSASSATIVQALSAVQESEIAVDAVVLGDEPAATAALEQLTASGEGYLLGSVHSFEASEAFASAATAFTSGVVLRVPVPDALAGEAASVRVYLRTEKGLVAGEVQRVLPGQPPEDHLFGTAVLVAGLTLLFGGLFGLLVLAVRSGDSFAVGRRRTREVLDAYSLVRSTGGPALTPSSRIGDGAAARGLLTLAGALLRRGEVEARLAARLERADVRFTPREWVAVHLLATVLAVLVVTLITNVALGVLAGVAAGFALHLLLGVRASRRQRAFTDVMPEALQLIAGGLATGYSLHQALDSVVGEGAEPLASEFGRALAEARVGVPLEVALDKVADRMESEDFRWVVMAIRVQRDVGGNLSEVLTTIVQTMRDRAALRRQVRALSAEGRLGAIILTGLPILVTLYLATFSRDFFSPMLTTTIGHVLLASCAVSLALGGLWLKKLVKVEM